jgi:hypothetical protein
MLQPKPDTPGQSRKTTGQETLKTAYISAIFRQGGTCPESPDLTYKEASLVRIQYRPLINYLDNH